MLARLSSRLGDHCRYHAHPEGKTPDNQTLLIMQKIKRILTFTACFILLLPVFLFDTLVGCVQLRIETSLGPILLVTAFWLSLLLSYSLVFVGSLPWCSDGEHLGNRPVSRICISIVGMATVLMVCLYSSITFLDTTPNNVQLAKVGMTKTQVLQAVGQPDWKEGQLLWAYRVKGDGIAGILVPYYFTFDSKGFLVSVHS